MTSRWKMWIVCIPVWNLIVPKNEKVHEIYKIFQVFNRSCLMFNRILKYWFSSFMIINIKWFNIGMKLLGILIMHYVFNQAFNGEVSIFEVYQVFLVNMKIWRGENQLTSEYVLQNEEQVKSFFDIFLE